VDRGSITLSSPVQWLGPHRTAKAQPDHGAIYERLGEYQNAVDYGLKAAQQSRENGDNLGEAFLSRIWGKLIGLRAIIRMHLNISLML